MAIHLIGMAHTETTTEYDWCAYTAKVRKLATMLTRAGEDVVLYAGEDNEAECREHVTIVNRAEQTSFWPNWDKANQTFNDFNPSSPGQSTFNTRAIEEISKRLQPQDIIGFTMGLAQVPIWTGLNRGDVTPVEVGIGYEGVWAPYRVFESHAWRGHLAGLNHETDFRAFDTVIPNFFEPEAFPAGAGDGQYFLYVGRLIKRKGVHIAAEACKRLGASLLVAGQGVASARLGHIVCTDGTVIEGDVEYVGVVTPAERAVLMGRAQAIFVPTTYFEPFGGVSVEAQMTGTPAIVSNWGGLVENVIENVTGNKCSTLAEFANAAKDANSFDRNFIRSHAQATWSTDVLVKDYIAYFDRLKTLYGAGWYA